MEDKKERSLEENFDRLEELIEALSDSDVSLEDAFRAYSEGVNLLKECNDQIDRVEKKVLVLSGNGELEELDQDDAEE
ncbi:MAG: exodeoxyribonuclease VII small subunit [Lachnospiraceae bacterium]|jgi:exodeoxyribonuclease VII small subunit|nr:exodeoxyribonuclease VII small subunit [Lachnospiraceae bacterium]MBQ6094595.1 exodeoxyribonuclease VII small subunit [Lachnospiraceae bacterium]MBR3470231.1 exodeoxyribonuclease VII small subunit [Lachnospiraceae bacterium]